MSQTAKPFRHLYGLLLQLEGVLRDTIHEIESEGLQNVLREYERSNPQDQKTVLQRQQSFCQGIYQNQTRALTAWRKGQASLWIGEMKHHFPSTWKAARNTPSIGKGREPIILKDYTINGFTLPMGNLTSSLEAVNAAMSFLSEYSLKEKVAWKPKLVL